MAWTAARTWTDGEVPTAAHMNAVRDNLRYLKGLDGAVDIEDILRITQSTSKFTTSPFYVSRYNAGEEQAIKITRTAADTCTAYIYDDNYSPAWNEIYHAGNLAGADAHDHPGFGATAAAAVTTHDTWTDICSAAVTTESGLYLIVGHADVLLDASHDSEILVRLQVDDGVGGTLNSHECILYNLSGDLRTRISIFWLADLTQTTDTVRFQVYLTSIGSPAGSSQVYADASAKSAFRAVWIDEN